ncbi:DUF3592 domain-containing protein [bacterium]|nr:MAG: DUF3592 domain-containing protein [bacterium]
MGMISKAKERIAKLFSAAVICVVFGVSSYFIFRGLGQIWLKYRSQSWLHVTGTILKSEVYVRNGNKGTSFWASVIYEYKVGGAKYKNHVIKFGQAGSGREDEASAAVEFYSVGKQVPVYYSPNFPSTACLQPG